MKRSLRTRLEELENGEAPSRTIESNVLPADNSTTTPRPSQCSPAVSLKSAFDGEISTIDYSNPAENSMVAHFYGEDAAGDDSITLRRRSVAHVESPLRCIQPCNFEKLMKPIDVAISGDSSTTITAPILAADSTPSSARTAGSRTVATYCACDRLLDSMNWRLPLQRYADSLVAVYFCRQNRMFPILHKLTFMRQYEQLWESKDASKATREPECSGLCKQKSRGRLFPATVYTVLALGCLLASQSPEQNAARAAPFFRQAQEIDPP